MARRYELSKPRIPLSERLGRAPVDTRSRREPADLKGLLDRQQRERAARAAKPGEEQRANLKNFLLESVKGDGLVQLRARIQRRRHGVPTAEDVEAEKRIKEESRLAQTRVTARRKAAQERQLAPRTQQSLQERWQNVANGLADLLTQQQKRRDDLAVPLPVSLPQGSFDANEVAVLPVVQAAIEPTTFVGRTYVSGGNGFAPVVSQSENGEVNPAGFRSTATSQEEVGTVPATVVEATQEVVTAAPVHISVQPQEEIILYEGRGEYRQYPDGIFRPTIPPDLPLTSIRVLLK